MQPPPKKTRRAKPSFELPAETESQSTAAGWVFRDKEEPGATVIPITSAPAVERLPAPPALAPLSEKPQVSERTSAHPLLIAGAGMFFVGVGSAGVVALVALAFTATPIRLVKGLFGG